MFSVELVFLFPIDSKIIFSITIFCSSFYPICCKSYSWVSISFLWRLTMFYKVARHLRNSFATSIKFRFLLTTSSITKTLHLSSICFPFYFLVWGITIFLSPLSTDLDSGVTMKGILPCLTVAEIRSVFKFSIRLYAWVLDGAYSCRDSSW